MDEILIKNFMIFQDAVEECAYDLVIADEAWDVDHYWHEHPELKRSQLAWMTDFVGYIPMPGGGEREAMLTTDYNAEMIEHIERHSGVRDRAIFVGTPDDIVPLSFGADLPLMRDWIPKHFGFADYVIGEHPEISEAAPLCGKCWAIATTSGSASSPSADQASARIWCGASCRPIPS